MKLVHKEYQLQRHFIKHAVSNITMALILIALALGVGMWGYHIFDGLSWIDSFINASMILSGMGPVDPFKTDMAKLFAGFYALFSGLFFILIIGILLAPFAAHSFKKWHLEVVKL